MSETGGHDSNLSPGASESRFHYLHGIFLTHYATFVATFLASLGWFAVLWTQNLPSGIPPRVALGIGTLVLNLPSIYFLSGVQLYSYLLTSLYVPNVVEEAIRGTSAREERCWSMRLALWLRDRMLTRDPPRFIDRGHGARTLPYFLGGLAAIVTLILLELAALVLR